MSLAKYLMPKKVRLEYDFAILSGGVSSWIEMFDITDPSAMTSLGSFTDATNFGRITGLAISDTDETVYLADWDNQEIHSVDISNPASMSLTDTLAVGFTIHDIKIDQSREVLFAAGLTKVAVVDVSNPASLSLVGTAYTSNASSYPRCALDLENDRMFVSRNPTDGFEIWDISNTASLVRDYNTISATYDKTMSGFHIPNSDRFIFVEYDDAQAQIIECSTPSTPTFEGSVTSLVNVSDVVVIGDHAFVSSRISLQGHVQSLDISNPASPSSVSSVFINATDKYRLAADPAAQVVYAAVPGSGQQLHAVDVSDPASMTVLDSISPGTQIGTDGGYIALGKYP